MLPLKATIFFVIILFINSHAPAVQYARLDSLLNLLAKSDEDTGKVTLLNELSEEINTDQPEKAIEYANQALELAQKLNNYDGISLSLSKLGIIYDQQGLYNKAMHCYMQCLQIFENSGNKTGMKNTYNNIGVNYYNQGEYDKALDNFLRSLKLEEKSGNKPGIAASYNNIGTLYFYQKKLEKALEYFFKGLKIFEGLNDQKGLATTYNNIALVYDQQGLHDITIKYYLKTLNIWLELGAKEGIAYSYNNIGDYYKGQKEYDRAVEYYQKSLEIYEDVNDQHGVSFALMGIGEIYINKGNGIFAIRHLERGADIASTIGARNELSDIYNLLSKAYNLTHNFVKAKEFFQKYTDIKDSILSEENTKSMLELENRFEFENREQEIQLLKNEREIQTLLVEKQKNKLQKQKIIITGSVIVVFLVLFLAVLMYNRSKIKQKANQKLSDQNKEIEKQKQIIELKSKRITSSIKYAKRIQESLLPKKEKLKTMLPDSFILFMPKDIVSGDFYWFSEKKGRIIVAVADCTGHGVPGAFMSLVGNELLNDIIINQDIVEPGEILKKLNDGVLSALGKNEKGEVDSLSGMDVAICSIDRQSRRLWFSAAGTPLILVYDGEVKTIKNGQLPVGLDLGKKIKYETEFIQLKENENVYICSDGYCSQFGGAKGDKFSTDRFNRLLSDIDPQSMERKKESLIASIEDWMDDKHEQVDDICIIGFIV